MLGMAHLPLADSAVLEVLRRELPALGQASGAFARGRAEFALLEGDAPVDLLEELGVALLELVPGMDSYSAFGQIRLDVARSRRPT